MLIIADSSALVALALYQITITGSLGILLLAKHQRLIPQVKPYLDQLRQTNLRISERLIQRTLIVAKE